MKNIIGLFVIVLVAIGVADLLQGVLLTFLYDPSAYGQGTTDMGNLMKYTISAATVTVALWSATKLRSRFTRSKASTETQ